MELKELNYVVDVSLEFYKQKYGLEFLNHNSLQETPDKPNSARTIVEVGVDGQAAGLMYVIAFQNGDGTGSEVDYKVDEVQIPSKYVHGTMPERVIPRDKDGVVCEAFFPLGAVHEQLGVHYHTASLQELSIGAQNELVRVADIGQAEIDFLRTIARGEDANPQIYMTVGTLPTGKRFGDPHAIYHGITKESVAPFGVSPNIVQVAGFLSLDKGNPLLERCSEFKFPAMYGRGMKNDR